MDSDIQFGDVEELRPEQRRRPDRDRHFAVCAYGTPAEGDLPIFIDMDVMADVEAHATSDPDVELGGVLLGGQFEDQDGCPFVLVLDSLRAEHYESSRGHFKFTHDTWAQISRQRDEFSDDLQMVGWYHTHPNWGVFLSGMDRFICENFFNRPLDVALVVDPLRGDRGWFYWGGRGAELPQAGGFGVISSRFRRRELQTFVELLEEDTAMTTERLSGAASRLPPQQIIHTIRPQLGWIGTAVIAMLVLQVCTTLMVALRLGAPAGDDSAAANGDLSSQQEATAELDRREQRLTAREEVFQDLLGHVKLDRDGSLDVESLVEEYKLLRQQVDQQKKTDILLGEAAKWIDEDRRRLQAEISRLEESKQELDARNEELQGDLKQIKALHKEDKEAADKKIKKLEKQLAEAKGEDLEEGGKTGIWSKRNIILAVAAGLLIVGALAAVIIGRKLRRRRLS